MPRRDDDADVARQGVSKEPKRLHDERRVYGVKVVEDQNHTSINQSEAIAQQLDSTQDLIWQARSEGESDVQDTE